MLLQAGLLRSGEKLKKLKRWKNFGRINFGRITISAS